MWGQLSRGKLLLLFLSFDFSHFISRPKLESFSTFFRDIMGEFFPLCKFYSFEVIIDGNQPVTEIQWVNILIIYLRDLTPTASQVT